MKKMSISESLRFKNAIDTAHQFRFKIIPRYNLNADSIHFVVEGISFRDFMDKIKK